MLVSFYIQIIIICLALLVTLLPFLGFPLPLDKALTVILGASLLTVAVYSLYRGYVRILEREEKRRLEYIKNKEKNKETVTITRKQNTD